MPKLMDLTGKRFGKLTVLSKAQPHKNANGTTAGMWNVRCDCGKEFTVITHSLISGNTKSCGCFKLNRVANLNKTHGKGHCKIYNAWRGMKERCYRKECDAYKNYGERGIKICKEWLGENGFQMSYDWAMANGYSEGLTIDRIDVNGNYEPSNCRWVTRKVQMNNTRVNRRYCFNGEVLTIAQLSEKYGIHVQTLLSRLRVGKSIDDAINTPIRGHK